ncbi:MAG: hypothetical protein CFE21_07665 [Bacteroidetes bacterium B1(2017)]|nr:MAG: hypothetical protein CFE21_07665 [Bacteroidetes bacterium B1(2017)]
MIKVSPELVRIFLFNHPFEYKSTHRKICYPLLVRLIRKIEEGNEFEEIKVEDDIIINGHHRYIALKYLNEPIKIQIWKRSPTTEICPWDKVEVDINDWETLAQIERYRS